MGYLDYNGLSHFKDKLTTIFAPIVHTHNVATTSSAGFMSATDKTKVDGIDSTYIKNASLTQSSALWTFTKGNNTTFTVDASNYPTQKLARPTQLNGLNDNTLQTLVSTSRANRLAFLPADQIIIEKTTDGGVTWVDAGISDAKKIQLFSEVRPGGITLPLIDGVRNINCGLRITFTAMKYNVPSDTSETQKYNYWNSSYIKSQERYCQLKEFYFWLSSSTDGIKIIAERATGGNANVWTTIFNNDSWAATGWSGCDYIRFSQGTFGGGTNQTGNYWNYRLTFFTRNSSGGTSLSPSSTTQAQSIMEIRGYGDSVWGISNNYMSKDHLYTFNESQDATFPAKITATKFIGPLQGNSDTATKATQDESGNNIKASYGHSLSLSGSSLSLVNMNGTAVGSAVTLPSLSDIDCGTY